MAVKIDESWRPQLKPRDPKSSHGKAGNRHKTDLPWSIMQEIEILASFTVTAIRRAPS